MDAFPVVIWYNIIWHVEAHQLAPPDLSNLYEVVTKSLLGVTVDRLPGEFPKVTVRKAHGHLSAACHIMPRPNICILNQQHAYCLVCSIFVARFASIKPAHFVCAFGLAVPNDTVLLFAQIRLQLNICDGRPLSAQHQLRRTI